MSAYLPLEERREVIRSYARKHNIRTMVETGTNDGDTVASLLPDMDLIYTIELDEALYQNACQRFEGDLRVRCCYGDSGIVLPYVVGHQISDPVLFWLDGHFCGGPTRGPVDTPIREELQAAVGAPWGSVILVDDARLFGGMPEHTEEFKDYPALSWVQDLAKAAGFDFSLQDDVMRLEPSVQNH